MLHAAGVSCVVFELDQDALLHNERAGDQVWYHDEFRVSRISQTALSSEEPWVNNTNEGDYILDTPASSFQQNNHHQDGAARHDRLANVYSACHRTHDRFPRSSPEL